MAFQNANAIDVSGGTIDGTAIGNTTPSSGKFTSAYDSGAVPTLPNQLVNLAFVQSLVQSMFFTGMTVGFMDLLANVEPGWIPWVDGSIGNIGSGASILQSPAAETLFTKLWNASASVPTNCPVLPARGASAAADWTANCTIALPRGNGCVVGILGAAALSPTTSARNFGDALGEETHQLTIAEMPAHSHDITYFSTSGGEAAPRIGQPPQAPSSFPTSNTGGDAPHNTMQPTTFIAWVVKL